MEMVRKWEELQTDCLVKVFEKVGLEGLTSYVPLVCKTWYAASLDPQCWRVLDFPRDACTKQIKLAVDRSCGTATRIWFPRKCSSEDFIYVSERCPSLKFVFLPQNIVDCTSSNDCQCGKNHRSIIPNLVGKWRELEFLQLGTGFYFKEILTHVGSQCENFVELKLTSRVESKHAVAIVDLLPKIKYLRLRMTIVISRLSIALILVGCEKLEEVDVSYCYGFDGEDEEILNLASHLRIFKARGTKLRSPFLDYLECETGFSLHGHEVGYY